MIVIRLVGSISWRKKGGRVRIGGRLGVKVDAQGIERKGGRVEIRCRLEGKAAVDWGF